MGRVTSRRRVVRLVDDAATARPDTLAVEEPLEIRVGGKSLAVTMRTPGDDFDLAAGFLVSEGVVRATSDIASIRYCAGATSDGGNTYNVLDVGLAPGVAPPDPSIERNFYTTSSCGLCGKASLDSVRTTATWQVAADPVRLDPRMITEFPTKLLAAQRVFDRTGGLHAAGLVRRVRCAAVPAGGRGPAQRGGQGGRLGHPLRTVATHGNGADVSGRASFELVQKAVMAGIPVLTAVFAPSSLAADLAEEMGLTLVGFLRGTSMNIYTGGHRLGVAVGAR